MCHHLFHLSLHIHILPYSQTTLPPFPMDSSPSSASPSSSSWLAFSLSNNTHFNQTSNPSSLSLFQPFHPSQSFNTSSEQHQDGSFNGGCGEESFNGGLDLSMFSGSGPKLEDFLGTGCGSDLHVGQFSGENQAAEYGGDEELKSIAASFLRGYSSMNDQIVTECENNNNNNAAASAAVVAAAAAASAAAAMAVVPVVESPSAKKAVDTFGQRTSIYRGVTRHRWTGRYEAHLWDNSCRREGQSRKGRQVYLGGYDKEDKAARAYDLAALKYWGTTTTTNFPVTNYEKELEEMKNMSRQEFVASLRRKSSGFSRGASIYRGVTRHHQHGRWQARIGRVAGNKDLYLGTFSTQEEAAEAYDIAAIKFRGLNAVTNFDMSRYDVKSIANSNLPIGGLTGKSKLASSESHSDNKSSDGSRSDDRDLSSVTSYTSQPSSSTTTLNFAMPIKQDPTDTYWSSLQVYPNHPTTAPGPTAATTATHHHNKHTMFQSAMTSNGYAFHGLSNLNMDFSNGGYVHHQQQQQQVPFGTPMNVVPSNSYESSSSASYGNWVTPSGHVFQSAKPNISVFQTPIYGME